MGCLGQNTYNRNAPLMCNTWRPMLHIPTSHEMGSTSKLPVMIEILCW